MIDCVYDEVRLFSDGLAGVKQNDKFGYIDKVGKLMIPLIYESGYSFIDGVAGVSKNKKHSFIDKKGSELVNHRPSTFREELKKIIDENDKWGFLNRNGEQVITCKYDSVNPFREDLASVSLNNKWGFIDKNDNIAIQFVYDDAKSFKHGLAVVKQHNKYGFIDKKCK